MKAYPYDTLQVKKAACGFLYLLNALFIGNYRKILKVPEDAGRSVDNHPTPGYNRRIVPQAGIVRSLS